MPTAALLQILCSVLLHMQVIGDEDAVSGLGVYIYTMPYAATATDKGEKRGEPEAGGLEAGAWDAVSPWMAPSQKQQQQVSLAPYPRSSPLHV